MYDVVVATSRHSSIAGGHSANLWIWFGNRSLLPFPSQQKSWYQSWNLLRLKESLKGIIEVPVTVVTLTLLWLSNIVKPFYSGRAIAQAVSRWFPTAAARFRAQVLSCRICGGQSGRFSPSTSVSPANLYSPNCSTITLNYHQWLVQ
jgi:hypothetical protein